MPLSSSCYQWENSELGRYGVQQWLEGGEVVAVKKIIVRAFNGEVETFNGENLNASVDEYGRLYVREADSDVNLAIFYRWEYVRNAD